MMSLTPLHPALNVTKTKNWIPLSSYHKIARLLIAQVEEEQEIFEEKNITLFFSGLYLECLELLGILFQDMWWGQ